LLAKSFRSRKSAAVLNFAREEITICALAGQFFYRAADCAARLVTLAVVKWFFGTVSSFTDLLLFFLPKNITHGGDGAGSVYFFWSLLALLLAVAMVSVIGVLARYYIGKRLIAWADSQMLRLPVLNKIYGMIKQVDAAFTSGKTSSFKTVVLVEYPRAGIFSMGFITSERADEVQEKIGAKCVCVSSRRRRFPRADF